MSAKPARLTRARHPAAVASAAGAVPWAESSTGSTASVYVWKGGNGAFSNALEWSLSTNSQVHAVPGSADVALFSRGGIISGNGTVSQIQVTAAHVTFTGDISAFDTQSGIVVTGGLVLETGGTLNVSDFVTGDAATLTLDKGSTVNAGQGANGLPYGSVGLSVGGGHASFSGNTFNSSGLIAIGSSTNGVASAGTATMSVSAGAHVTASYTGMAGTGGVSSSASDQATLVLTGSGTTWSNTGTAVGAGGSGGMIVGVEGSATLTVAAGAVLSDETFGDVGGGASATGLATVTGTHSLWESQGALFVGDSGHGTLAVSAGGSVTAGAGLDLATSAAVIVGDAAGSVGRITVAGAVFHSVGQLDIGVDGSGSVAVGKAGKLVTGDASGQTASGIVLGFYSDGQGTLTVAGSGASVTNTGIFQLGVGTGRAVIAGGGTLATSIAGSLQYDGADIGVGGTGSVSVTGAGSRFSVATDVVLGVPGTGVLVVSAGANAAIGATSVLSDGATLFAGYSAGAHGTVSVTGTGSVLTVRGQADIGVSGTGRLSVGAGGTVTTGDASDATASGLVAGYAKGASGAVTLTGAGAVLTNRGVFVIGDQGHGSLGVSGGAHAVTSIAAGFGDDASDIGLQAGGSGAATVAGAGSEWLVGGTLDVGNLGSGTLTVASGGVVAAAAGDTLAVLAGNAKGGHGAIVVENAGSALEAASLLLGGTAGAAAGSASLGLESGGLVSVSGTTVIGRGATVSLSGGTLHAAGGMRFAGGSLSGYGLIQAPKVGGGKLTASGGTLTITGAVAGVGAAHMTLDVAAKAVLVLDASATAGVTADFTGAGALDLLAPQAFAGTIADFAAGDTVDLLRVSVTARSYAPGSGSGVLHLTLSNGDTAALRFSGSNTLQSFSFTSDGHGGTLIGHT